MITQSTLNLINDSHVSGPSRGEPAFIQQEVDRERPCVLFISSRLGAEISLRHRLFGRRISERPPRQTTSSERWPPRPRFRRLMPLCNRADTGSLTVCRLPRFQARACAKPAAPGAVGRFCARACPAYRMVRFATVQTRLGETASLRPNRFGARVFELGTVES
jgi:hypothetical protein